jgi:hypothetical protein
MLLGNDREMGEQHGRDALVLPGVGDEERDLRPLGILADVRGVRDDAPRGAALYDQREPIGVVDVHGPVGDPVKIRGAEEAKTDRLGRDALKERPDRRFVAGPDRPHVNGRAVSQRNLGFTVKRIRSGT